MSREFDSQRSVERARERLPLKRILEEAGYGPRGQGETWKSFRCPFCKSPKKAGVTEKGGRQWFKCFKVDCPSSNVPCKDEITILALLSGGSRRDAWEAWLRQAGVWDEYERSPSVLPGTSGRKRLMPDPPPATEGPVPATEPTPAAQEAEEVDASPTNELPDPPEEPIQQPLLDTVSAIAPVDEQPPASSPPPAPAAPETPPSSTEPPAPPVEPAQPEPPKQESPKNPLEEFWKRIQLLPDQMAELQVKRGLSRERIITAGFRTARRMNRGVLVELAKEFEPSELIECGLLVRATKEKGPRPNALYYGFTNTGKKNPDGSIMRDWVEPPLIPYWAPDGSGRLVYLRPHKDAPAGSEGHLYVPAGQSATGEVAMITEGEFKAEAFADAGLSGHLTAAIPGISMVREDSPGSFGILTDLWEWLKRSKVRVVVVVFDNEDKSLRIPDRRRRYDSEIWARYLAILAEKRGYKARVGHLPTEWMEGGKVVDGAMVGGKADWDSALAKLRREGKSAAEIQDAFRAVIKGAVRPNDPNQPGLFDQETEKIIQGGVSRKFYRPKLPCGGQREIKIAKRLSDAVSEMNGVNGHNKDEDSGKDDGDPSAARLKLVSEIARAYRDCAGRYYVLKPCVADASRKWWSDKLAAARSAANHPAAYIAHQVLEGMPTPKSDFVMEPQFLVNRVDGKVHRRVKLRNVHGEERVVNLGGEIHSPVKFREACISFGGFSWDGNENDLAALRNDTNQVLVGRTVNELVGFGWNNKARMWVFEDGAITDAGDIIKSDEDGIIWRDGVGYQMGQVDMEGEGFRMGAPQMHLGQGLRMTADGGYAIEDGADDPRALRSLASELMAALFNAAGGAEAWLAMGSVLAFAIGPEFFRKNQWFPGLWITGQRGSGKTTLARILISLWGFICDAGIPLKTSTPPGVLIAAQQYAFLPLWLDEYRHDLRPDLVDVLRTLYDRASGSKKQFSQLQRVIQTNAVVVGEHTSNDSATRQRFVHVHMAEERRLQNDLPWIKEVMPTLFTLTRHVLRNAKEFSSAFWKHYHDWSEQQSQRPMQERTKTVHAVGHAACLAFMEMFDAAPEWKVTLTTAAEKTAAEGDANVRTEANISVFFHEMLVCFKLGLFSEDSGGIRRYFHIRRASEENGWTKWELSFDAEPVHSIIRTHLRKGGRSIPIEVGDLRQQMAAQPYWRGVSRQRLSNGSPSASYVWTVALDGHPMGYVEADDAAVKAAWEKAEAEAKDAVDRGEEVTQQSVIPTIAERKAEIARRFVDPRKGEMYLIVDAIIEEQKKERT